MSADILSNIVDTLTAAMDGPDALFSKVLIVEDLDAFTRVADPLAGGGNGVVAGVIAKPPLWGNAHDSAEDHVERYEFQIALRLTVQRSPGQDDSDALNQLNALAVQVRAALLADPSRGGLAMPIRFEGKYLHATDLRGGPKIEPTKVGHAFYAATIPVVCGRRVERTF